MKYVPHDYQAYCMDDVRYFVHRVYAPDLISFK